MSGQPGVPGVPMARSLPARPHARNLATAWEQSAELSEEQLKLIDLVSQCCAVRPVPEHVVDDIRVTPAGGGVEPSKDTFHGTLDGAVLHNTNQFHKWHTELEAACALEQEEKYKRYADLLNSHLRTCESILNKVDRTLEMFDALLAQHRDVSQRSKALHASCEQLVREKDSLVEFADAIKVKLKFFDELETVSAQFQKAQLSLDNDQYLSLLKKLDDCLAYVASNPQYADASTYTSKFRQLQSRALGSVRNKVAKVLQHAVAQVQAAIQEAAPSAQRTGVVLPANGHLPSSPSAATAQGVGQGAAPLAEGAEVSLLYVRFRAAAEPQLKGLLRELHTRGQQRPEYQRLLEECQALYCAARQQLVSPFLQQRLSHELAGLPLLPLTRAGCEQLLRVCQLEWQLLEQFFPPQPPPVQPTRGAGTSRVSAVPSAAAADAWSGLTEPLCTLLYDALRPRIITLQDVDELCEMVDILRHEVLGEQLSRRGPAGEALRPLAERTLADVRSRVIFRCQAFIREEVASYQATPDDIDYPAKLERSAPSVTQGEATNQGPGHAGATEPQGNGTSGGAQSQRPGPDPYAPLYPPLRATLVVLSKLYRAVEAKTFGGMAQEAVSACTLSVQQAGRQVARRSSPLDAQLFMIKHLLFLREQIAPFDVDFAVTDIDLDFSHMREHMRRLMSGETSLFALGSANAMVKMLGGAGPRVLTYQMDSKKELEKQLKGVCEAFIMALTKVAVEPMLSFITKVTAVRVAAQANPATAKPLREQAFASPARVASVVSAVNDALGAALPAAVAKMRLYLANPSTHAILFKPVKSNIAEAHGQVANLLAGEYTPEEAATIPLKNPQELAAALDALL